MLYSVYVQNNINQDIKSADPFLTEAGQTGVYRIYKDSKYSSKNHLLLYCHTQNSPIPALSIPLKGISSSYPQLKLPFPGLLSSVHPSFSRLQLEWAPDKYILKASFSYYLGGTKMNSANVLSLGK